MLLSRTPLDMVAGASHRPKNHPIETPQLSLPPCPMRVYLTKTGGHQAYAKMACRREPGQLQIMWAWCNGLQSHADDCSLSCNESCPGGVDGCSECGPANAVIAVLAGFDCRPLQLCWLAPVPSRGRASSALARASASRNTVRRRSKSPQCRQRASQSEAEIEGPHPGVAVVGQVREGLDGLLEVGQCLAERGAVPGPGARPAGRWSGLCAHTSARRA